MTSTLLALAASLLITTGTLAAPSLRAEVTVSDAVVTIGDMFADAGELAATPIFRAPAPGTAGIVALADVQRAARAAGLSDYDTVGLQQVRVARASSLVDASILDQLIDADLTARGILSSGVTAEIRYDVVELSFNAEVSDTPARLVSLRYMPGNGAFAARVAIAGFAQPIDLTGHIQLTVEAPRLIATKAAGTILTEDDFEMAPVPLATADAGGYAELSQLVGKQLVRQSRAGIMLKPTDVDEPTVVSRNALITAYVKAGPMTLTVKGTALGNAAAGEPIDVLNLVTRKVLHGIARPDGSVEIVTAIAVAGL